MNPDQNDLLFGLCDLGMQHPELGDVSLSELEGITLRFGLKIERDLWFDGKHPISVYAAQARNAGRIEG
jgi:hypothetical protein